jgi:zinc transport system substrate-binding protein
MSKYLFGNISLYLRDMKILFFVKWKFLLLAGAVFAGVLGCYSCGNGSAPGDNTLVVSIEPLRYLVEQIVGDDFEVMVLVPPGANPETYEPTPRQIRAAEKARLVFSTGLIGFETVILERFPAPERFVDLSAGIDIYTTVPMTSMATTAADPHTTGEADRFPSKHDHGGADPHIWMAPGSLSTMALTAYRRIHDIWPDSISYTANYEHLAERFAALDGEVSSRIGASRVRSFMIYHPGLTYYARDYGLRQIAIEIDGKEPSARQLADIVATARAEGLTKILYQSEFPQRAVEVVAEEIGAEPVEIGVLDYDVVGNILKITDLITGGGDTADDDAK